MSINCTLSFDFPSISSLLNNFSVRVRNDSALLSHELQAFIDQHQAFFDRFVVIYLEEDSDIVSPLFQKKLMDVKEVMRRDTLNELLISPLLDNSNYSATVEPPPELVNFLEYDDRIIQLIGVVFDQFLALISHHLLDNVPTCIVLVNIDQLCYHTAKLTQIVYSFLPKLSKWCGYLALTRNYLNVPFYQWLSQNLNKRFQQENPPFDPLQNYDNWFLLTLGDVFHDYYKENDPSLPEKFHSAMTDVCKKLPNLDNLLLKATIEQKKRAIRKIKKSMFGKKHWLTLHQLTLALYIATRIPQKERLLIVTGSFEQGTWNDFQKLMKFPYYSSQFRPTFWPIERVTELNPIILQNFNRVILDFGDEITPWLPTPLLTSFIERVKWIKPRITQIPVTLFHPLLIDSKALEWSLMNPPLPLTLGSVDSSVRRKMVVYQTILLTAHKRLRKNDFYQNIRSSWLRFTMDLELNESLTKYIKNLRKIGLLDKIHYHTTPLGRHFLEQELPIESFLEFLITHFPSLFDRSLTKSISKTLFLKYYLVCAAWFFYKQSDDKFDEWGWVIFLKTIRKSFNIEIFPSIIQDKVIEMMDDIRSKGIGTEHFEVTQYLRDIPDDILFELEFCTKKPARALIWALRDLLVWEKSFVNQRTPIPNSPFFNVRQKARQAARNDKEVCEASYVRAVTRIFDENNPSTSQYFVQQPLIPHFKKRVPSVIKSLRRTFKIRFIKLTNNRGSQVVVFRASRMHIWQLKLPFPVNFEYLSHSCKECIYFNRRRKRHCTLFHHFLDDPDIPIACKDRIDRKNPVFSSMVGCPVWRPKKVVEKKVNKRFPKYCYHCYQKLIRIRNQQKIVCQCGTEYELIRDNNRKELIGVRYQLTAHYRKYQETALLFPEYGEVTIVKEEDPSEVPWENHYFVKKDQPFLLLRNSTSYVQLAVSDELGYDRETNQLVIQDKNGYIRKYNPPDIQLIDTPRITQDLIDFVNIHPHVKINYRKHRLTLTNEASARFIRGIAPIPVLQVKHTEEYACRNYPLHTIASVFNIGKPRLIKLLEQYGVLSIYNSSNGISTDPLDTITDALTLEGVRPVLSEIHLLGLVVSILRASAQLLGMIYDSDNLVLYSQMYTRLIWLLLRSPERLFNYYRPFESDFQPSLQHQCVLEGWFFRPFAEGLRKYITLMKTGEAMLVVNEGRNVTRRVWKKEKDELDYYGCYSSFDSALNTIHRPMRYQFRSINARQGFGFNTEPIFSHQSHDKPGRSGHLDLEEVARILSRFIVLEGIRSKVIRGKDFEPRLDDENFIYYVPYYRNLKAIRSELVYKNLFRTPIHYNKHWIPLKEAHRQHVKHLRWCLEECTFRNSPNDRQQFLLEEYTPLIFHVKPFNQKDTDVEDELVNLFDYSWVNRTQKLWTRLGFDPLLANHHLFNSTLARRILSI